MSPKEKTEELLNKYKTFIVMWSGGVEVENENVKRCALIAVSELIQSYARYTGMYDQDFFNSERKYWEQVKTELIKERQHESCKI